MLIASADISGAETVYSYEHGPSTMCGIHGGDTADFLRQVRASLRQAPASDRFDLFVAGDGVTQWVFTKPSEKAYPAVTCRWLDKDPQGHWILKRKIRCEANRAACERLADEFASLDDQLRRSLADKK
ncbi:hypothetical protein EN828_22135 [Mesorhizobium sp. M2D.F.Ca.ET.185.01.1.1]|nr:MULTISPECIES: hypothetical protein [unclassified Mesorhizobium]TGP76900.1 hypothetical protein EN870_19925 [bacterium M00.F.Ca.ET.227.01.1.1]TGP84971.1 hypothetical protein EN864_28810 [bacterium M00.F.Ca.ET.221.01.1.1]TGP88541.1 hypothetical protein EN865_28110 [bacterium M00.F.Ca.ET.222.01.1.1]TGT68565.1 hypothetical protein EN802_27110 [bacterium M00.F.Ca.ET.159.01.1.1]TGT80399.1 hypothetical protein EN800_26450 [bacterium M00.F.Ca.ET.157.01.1.1]TGU04657.1 hypothetical protein EN806_387